MDDPSYPFHSLGKSPLRSVVCVSFYIVGIILNVTRSKTFSEKSVNKQNFGQQKRMQSSL